MEELRWAGQAKESRVCAPAWRRRDGKELFSMRREKGFNTPVSHPFSWSELVGDVRGIPTKGGARLASGSTEWRHVRGRERGGEEGGGA